MYCVEIKRGNVLIHTTNPQKTREMCESLIRTARKLDARAKMVFSYEICDAQSVDNQATDINPRVTQIRVDGRIDRWV